MDATATRRVELTSIEAKMRRMAADLETVKAYAATLAGDDWTLAGRGGDLTAIDAALEDAADHIGRLAAVAARRMR